MMNGRPLLSTLAQALQEEGVEAILIGNAAAVVNGIPSTRANIDFLLRKTPQNLKKLRAVAKSLRATLWRAVYPPSGVLRLARDDDYVRVDFITEAAGVRAFNSLRRRTQRIEVDGS